LAPGCTGGAKRPQRRWRSVRKQVELRIVARRGSGQARQHLAAASENGKLTADFAQAVLSKASTLSNGTARPGLASARLVLVVTLAD